MQIGTSSLENGWYMSKINTDIVHDSSIAILCVLLLENHIKYIKYIIFKARFFKKSRKLSINLYKILPDNIQIDQKAQ